MSGAIASTAAYAAVAYVAAQALAPKPPKAPEAPTLEKPPQASKAPNEVARRSAEGTAASVAAPSNTMLTGAGGVAPGTLALGKSTLLGQ